MKVIDYLAEELKLEEMGATKEAIASFGKFYPKTLQAFGGSKGLQKWLASDDVMPVRVARVFRVDNDRLFTTGRCADCDGEDILKFDGADAEALEELNDTELMTVIFNALPFVR